MIPSTVCIVISPVKNVMGQILMTAQSVLMTLLFYIMVNASMNAQKALTMKTRIQHVKVFFRSEVEKVSSKGGLAEFRSAIPKLPAWHDN